MKQAGDTIDECEKCRKTQNMCWTTAAYNSFVARFPCPEFEPKRSAKK